MLLIEQIPAWEPAQQHHSSSHTVLGQRKPLLCQYVGSQYVVSQNVGSQYVGSPLRFLVQRKTLLS